MSRHFTRDPESAPGPVMLTYIITHHRWILVLFFLMPASLVLVG